MAPVSEAKKKANYKWEKANYKRINVAFNFQEYEVIDSYCAEHGLSKNEFMKIAAKEKIARDTM